MKKGLLIAFMCLGITQLWAQQGVVFKIKYLPNKNYQSNISMDMKANATVTGDQQIIDKLKEQGITQPVNANLSIALGGIMKTGAMSADQSMPVSIDYKVNNISFSANGNQVPIPPKATEKDIKMVGHISQDWKLKIDSANGKAVADSAQQKMQQMMNMVQKQIQFPDKPLKPGDSFTQTIPMNIPAKDGNNIKIDVGVTYKLIRIGDGKAYFDMIPNFSLNIQVKNFTVDMSGTGTGSMVYSIKDSFPISKEGNVNVKIKVTSPKINVDGTAVVTSKYDCVIN
jgi:subtilisin family serine protease